MISAKEGKVKRKEPNTNLDYESRENEGTNQIEKPPSTPTQKNRSNYWGGKGENGREEGKGRPIH